jgi:hypothetical protein
MFSSGPMIAAAQLRMNRQFQSHCIHWRRMWVVLGVAISVAACSKREQASAAPPPTAVAADAVAAAADGMMAPSAKPSAPHGGHDPAHGGLVLMDAHDHHAELVLDTKGGKHRVFISDGARAPLPASTFDEVQLSIARPSGPVEKLAMTKAADDTYWQATGTPIPEQQAKVSLSYGKGGKPLYQVELPVEYVLTGKMPDEPASSSAEPPAAAPHGGLVSTTSSGHIELVASRSGRFEIWLLDAKLATRRTTGATVTVQVAKGSAVTAAEAGDHFIATTEAISAGHVTATVTVTASGKTESAQFKLHLENAGNRKAGGHSGH